MSKPYIIGIASSKGGVGKTSISVNMAVALRMAGKKVLLVDLDTVNPNVGMHLGMEDLNKGLIDLFNKDNRIEIVKSVHGPTGLHVIVGVLNTKPFILSKENFETISKKLVNSAYEYIIIDTAPGIFSKESMRWWNEALLVTTPDTPAVTGILRFCAELDGSKIRHHIALNRFKRTSYELQQYEIEEAAANKVVAVIPEDEIVSQGIAERIPAYLIDKNSDFSIELRKLSKKYSWRKSKILGLFKFLSRRE